MFPPKCDLDGVRDFLRFCFRANGLSTTNVVITPFFGGDGTLQPFVHIRFLGRIVSGTYAEIVGAISISKTLAALLQVCAERNLLRPNRPFPKMWTWSS